MFNKYVINKNMLKNVPIRCPDKKYSTAASLRDHILTTHGIGKEE